MSHSLPQRTKKSERLRLCVANFGEQEHDAVGMQSGNGSHENNEMQIRLN